jgi:hypothetical protein
MIQELNKGMIQSSHRSTTKIYHKANMLTREDTMELDKNDMDEQHDIAT